MFVTDLLELSILYDVGERTIRMAVRRLMPLPGKTVKYKRFTAL